jgi:hypothetical protein
MVMEHLRYQWGRSPLHVCFNMSKKREQIQKEKEERRRKMLEEDPMHESKYARKARLKRLQKRGIAK